MSKLPEKIAASLLIFIVAVNGSAQQPVPPTRQEAAVRAKVAHLSPQAPISVIPFQSAEEFGSFVASTDTGFTFYDVDRKSNVTFRYSEVRKIKDGYGGYNSAQGRHVDHTRSLIFFGIAIGVLVGVVVAVAASKN